ncbi:MAG: hypothetical protein HRT35_37350, partial [Algicola sp.]|nr:hypothetical protein [Algicola sp.]
NQAAPGKTIVINWPLWQDGGMGPGNAAKTALYLKNSGLETITDEQGLAIFQELLNANQPQNCQPATLVMTGQAARITQLLQHKYQVPVPQQVHQPSQRICVTADVVTDIKRIVADCLDQDENKLDNTTNWVDFGFDSITLRQLASKLSDHFGLQVTPALFFSAATIGQLVEYYNDKHPDKLKEIYRQVAVLQEPVDQEVSVEVTRVSSEPIAIIGMSGRFPQAANVDEFWRLLEQGQSAIGDIPTSRWDWRDYFTVPGDVNNKITTNQGGFIDGVDEFDPLFFEISPREAQEMDPSERILLMEAYRAIEDARLSPASLRGCDVGVFVGMEEGQYTQVTGTHSITTSGNAMISSRLSYFLDLHGPAIATNTACSSGLVALHEAARSLSRGDCQSALVAGISLSLSPINYVMMSQAGMLSQDGQCHSFAKNANGIGVGEAVVVLMLKPLSVAQANGDAIYGTIKASGINFDGKTNGVTAPNGKMQAALIANVYRDNNINVNDIGHIVTHGTGTPLGDPVEINALNDVFDTLQTDKKTGYCNITSCKSNIGHTMAASGLVSVVSLLKGMQHHKIPASINCQQQSEYINWQQSPFVVNTATLDWQKTNNKPHLGAVSSFGRSGTNAHVVIEEYVAAQINDTPLETDASNDKVAIVLSARTDEQLQQKVADLLQHISEQKVDLAAMAYTLQVGREAMARRVVLMVDSVEQLITKLQALVDGQSDINLFKDQDMPL